ncbi:hypothetical protein EV426DRAFT_701799 [Tirmania nivea]|nr:hypothetical protein EV426DRAFT_701799 [Tirmania nivea]
MDVLSQFSQLYHEAEKGNSTPPVRFLSRFDKSGTNIKESILFLRISQSQLGNTQYIGFPIQALNAAIIVEEYIVTDRGAWFSLPANVTNGAVIYKQGGDSDPDDLLLIPAHLLISAHA